MSTSQERYAAITENYQSALNNEISDKAQATTVAQVAAIAANVANAAVTFYSVTADILSAAEVAIEADYNAAVQANGAVTQARNSIIPTSITNLLPLLSNATTAASNLASSAKAS